MIAMVQFVAAGLAAVLLLVAGLMRIRGSWDDLHADLRKVSMWNGAGALAGAMVFGCEVAKHLWPGL